jgi:hypothetical protein
VAAVTRAGGTVGYSGDDSPRWCQRLVDAIGRDYFDTAISVNVDVKDAPDADALMARVARLGGLQQLSFDGEKLTNEGIAHVRHLRHLQALQLFGTFTGAALAEFENLSALQYLSINSNCSFRDGLPHLRCLTDLRRLFLWDDDRLTDADLAQFEGLTNLEDLDLGPTRVTDAGLVHLRGLNKLQSVSFSWHEISDGAMAKLQQDRPKLQVTVPPKAPTPGPAPPSKTSKPAAQPSNDLVAPADGSL